MSNTLSNSIDRPSEPSEAKVFVPAKTKKQKWKRIVVIGAIVTCLICCSIISWRAVMPGIDTHSQKPAVEKVIDQFIRAMIARDVDSAYSLFSKDAQEHVKPEELAETFFGQGDILYEGYQTTSILDLTISSPIFTSGKYSQTTASARGVITYLDGTTTTVDADFELEDGQWKLVHIFIALPPK